MEKLKLSILTALLSLSAALGHAETNEYNIEIVIFEDSSNSYINSEQWPIINHPENPEPHQNTETNQAQYADINSVNNITRNDANMLVDHVKKLSRSSRYNVLLHKSWQQTGLDNANAIDMVIDSRKSKNDIKEIMLPAPNSNSQKQTNSTLESNVQGTMKLILGRYLHIHTDLIYQRPNKAYNPVSPALNNKRFNEFEIKSQRRMRSSELHYIDHPLLGILVLVTPIEVTQPVTENATENTPQ